MNTITPTSGIDLLVHLGVERLREKAMSPALESSGVPSPMSGFFPRGTNSRHSRTRSGDHSCFQLDPSEQSSLPEARSKLLELPNELQYMIVRHLGFGDMERMRRTCHYYRRILNPDFIREHFGGEQLFGWQLTSHCQTCLEKPGRHRLILQPDSRPASSKCFRCSVQERALHVGTNLPLANARSTWVCRWCGWPISGAPSWANEQFHINCYDRYHSVLWVFLCLGFAQLAVGVVAATLSLIYFRADLLVLAPAVITFVLLWVCMAFLMFRGNRVRTYHWVGLLEFVILGLWIPPIYSVARIMSDGSIEKTMIVAMVFFVLNGLFRLLNFVGNIMLTLGYDMTKHHIPQQSLRRRLLNMLMSGLIYWTYPQCVEQRYPPDYN